MYVKYSFTLIVIDLLKFVNVYNNFSLKNKFM